MWGVTCLSIFARRAASLTDFCTNDSWMWWRRVIPVRLSLEISEAGKRYCQIQSLFAFWYLRSNA